MPTQVPLFREFIYARSYTGEKNYIFTILLKNSKFFRYQRLKKCLYIFRL